jgi:molybdopterin converting factor small subunit
MTAKVVIPGVLRDLAGGAHELTVELSEGAPLAEVLDGAFSRWPILNSRIRDERGEIRRHVNVFVDGEDAKRAQGVRTRVGPGSTVHVINAVSGG